jgi:hypothetical protein
MPTEKMNGNTMKVNFLIIGAARSATTSLSQILGSHPDICFSSTKEPQFFCKENWRESLNQYHALFTKEAKLYGEGSTNYSKYPSFNTSIHADIYEYNPEMKFIYIMRHPLERIVSHYKFALERGYTTTEINKEVIENPIYINTSMYYSQVKLYIDQFGRDKIKLILFDDFKKDPKKTLDEVFDFLDVPIFDYNKDLLHSNKSLSGAIGHKKYDNPMTFQDKLKKLWHYFNRKVYSSKISHDPLSHDTELKIYSDLKDDILQLENLLDRDLSHWLVS